MKVLSTLSVFVAASVSMADFQTTVIASGLASPTGIAVSGAGGGTTVYFTQVPTPGVPGSMGGMNSVNFLTRTSMGVISMGEPEPVNLALSNRGDLYWTCRTAGVILGMDHRTHEVGLVLGGLDMPTGIATYKDELFFTQLPTPGVPGGMNTVNRYADGVVTTLTMGEPEPTDIAVDNQGTAYWTCKSAGVILKRTRDGAVSLVRGMLDNPTGIALDKSGRSLYFTEVPTPGIPGSMGGTNKVWRHDLRTGGLELVHAGDPEPRDIAVAADGAVYWTCTSAGVIVRAARN
ncbi:MAG: hypothetical protein WD716_02135 [Fimbriimonadaceae bacterium]